MKIRCLYPLLLILLLALGLTISGCSSDGGAYRSFTADTLDGGTYTGKDIAENDLTIINFWGTYCGPCIGEMPELAAFERALPDNVQLITVCIDASGSEDIAGYLLMSAGYEGVTLTSGDEGFQRLLEGIQAVPTTVFVDSDGNQVGDPIIGAQPDLESAYLSAVNKALKACGKAEISLEG